MNESIDELWYRHEWTPGYGLIFMKIINHERSNQSILQNIFTLDVTKQSNRTKRWRYYKLLNKTKHVWVGMKTTVKLEREVSPSPSESLTVNFIISLWNLLKCIFQVTAEISCKMSWMNNWRWKRFSWSFGVHSGGESC